MRPTHLHTSLIPVLLGSLLTGACGSDGDPSAAVTGGTDGAGAPATGGAESGGVGTGGEHAGGTATGGTATGGTATGGESGASAQAIGDAGEAGSSPAGGTGGEAGTGTSSGAWSMGYYASWQAPDYPVAEIEWSGLTQVAMSFYMPDADGTLSLLGGNPDVAAQLVSAAHAHDVRAIASIGGADSATAFREAMTAGIQASFVDNLVALLDDEGYDGLDVDWEPLETTDEPAVIAIAEQIRAVRPQALLTIPIGCVNVNLGGDLSGYAAIAAAYDQLNLMSYGQAGAWEGWNSWHSSALYHTNSATPISIDSSVDLYVAAGVPVEQLGLGIGFYGLCYSEPVTAPDQPLEGAAILASDSVMSYANIMGSYYDPAARHWDALARVPYLSFTAPHAPDGCTYISYDDEESIAEKGAYVKSKGLGGVIQWELNEGYLGSAPAGQRNPLLVAIRDHVLH
jgi:chitinase